MPSVDLLNKASVAGMYGEIPTELTSEAVTVQLVDGITIVKSASTDVWADTNYLTYTVVIANNSDETFTDATFTDLLDTLKIDYVADSAQVDDQPATASYESDTLTIELPDIAIGDSVTVTFQVQKV